MGKIVAIGGGMIRDLETLKIDKEVVRLTNKNNPKALFIPTASNDAEKYCKVFQKVYGDKLNCKTDILYLIKKSLTKTEIRNKILESDLIYVGGGNTKKMINIWKELKVNKFLEEALKKDIVLSGLSAGSICWFEYGHSDSLSFSEGENWEYIKVNGLGFIDAFHCPHYNEDDRAGNFFEMIDENNEIGIAIENNCAIEFIDNTYRVISSKGNTKAYKIYKQNEEIICETIKKEGNFKDINEIVTLS